VEPIHKINHQKRNFCIIRKYGRCSHNTDHNLTKNSCITIIYFLQNYLVNGKHIIKTNSKTTFFCKQFNTINCLSMINSFKMLNNCFIAPFFTMCRMGTPIKKRFSIVLSGYLNGLCYISNGNALFHHHCRLT